MWSDTTQLWICYNSMGLSERLYKIEHWISTSYSKWAGSVGLGHFEFVLFRVQVISDLGNFKFGPCRILVFSGSDSSQA